MIVLLLVRAQARTEGLSLEIYRGNKMFSVCVSNMSGTDYAYFPTAGIKDYPYSHRDVALNYSHIPVGIVRVDLYTGRVTK